MNTKTRKIEFWKRKNIKGFSFFVVAAFLFLVLSKLSETYTQNVKIGIEVQGLDEEIKLVSDSTISINTLVKARGFSFVPLLFKSPKPIILDSKNDLKRIANQLQWNSYSNTSKLNQSLGKSFEVLSVFPDTLQINFDVLSSKKVPVEIKKELTFESGYDLLNDLTISNDSVKIVGLSEELKNISHLKTDVLKLTEISEDFERELSVNLPKNSKVEIAPKIITVKGTVAKFTEGEIKIPVIVVNMPNEININFFPKEVDLLYYVNLNDYNSINANEFKVICDFEKRSNNEQKFLIPEIVQKPEIVKRARLRQQRIEFIILE